MTLRRYWFAVTIIVSFAAALLLAPRTAAGQSVANATIRGRVLDSTDAALPGVTVTADSPALLVPQVTTATDAAGFYVLPDLPIGQYRLSFELAGFQRLVREQIVLTAGFTATINVSIQIGSLSETLTVVGASPVVDTSTSTPASACRRRCSPRCCR